MGCLRSFCCIPLHSLLLTAPRYCSNFTHLHYLPDSCITNEITAYINDVIYIYERFYLFIFRERGKEGGRGQEKHQSVASYMYAPACALTRNPTCIPLVHRPALNPLSHTSQGKMMLYLKYT